MKRSLGYARDDKMRNLVIDYWNLFGNWLLYLGYYAVNMKTEQIIITEVENKPGVLTRVASLCRRRRYNIESLTVSATKNPEISQITFVFFEEEERIQKIINQIDKLIEVLSVEKASHDTINKELVLLIIRNQKIANQLLEKKSDDINIKIIKKQNNNLILEIISTSNIIELLINKIKKEDIIKIVRSGVVALKIE